MFLHLNLAYFLVVRKNLLYLSGNVEKNPGPVINYKDLYNKASGYQNNLKFFHCNAQSIAGQYSLVKNLINDLGNNTVFGFSETWLSSKHPSSFWKINCNLFESYRKDRCKNNVKSKGGGVMLFVPKQFPSKVRQDLVTHSHEVFESLWVEFIVPNGNKSETFLINVSYCPNKSLTTRFLDELALGIDKAISEKKRIILLGDYNINFFDQNERNLLETLIIPYGLSSCNTTTPTRIFKKCRSLIDYVISEEFLCCYIAETILKTDHYATMAISPKLIENKKSPQIKFIFNKKNYCAKKFNDHLLTMDWRFFYEQTSAATMFDVFCQNIEQAIVKYAPIKKVFIRNDKPKFTLYQNWVSKSTYKAWINGFDSNKRKHDNLIKEEDTHKLNIYNSLRNYKSRWNFVNELRNSKRTSINIHSLQNSFGDLITNQKDILNLLNYTFSKLGEFFSKDQSAPLDTHKTFLRKTFSFRFLTTKEVFDLLKNLKVAKPLGPSKIPAWALRDAKSALAEPLCFLINEYIKVGEFPEPLKHANVIPLFKKGDPQDPTNYRPISITGALAKVFEQALANQITEHCERFNIFSNTQYGYKKKHSTIDALLYCTEYIRKEIDEKRSVYGAFLDLSKAFDSISHQLILNKLLNYGFNNLSVQLLKSYLCCRSQQVVLNNIKSDIIELKQGVPQGTVLGPLLFNLYVNDLALAVDNNVKIVQYADDTFIFSSNENTDMGIHHLENNISKLLKYFSANFLKVNKDKTEFIVFETPNQERSRNEKLILTIDNEKVVEKDNVKYLGVYLDKFLKYETEVKHILQKWQKVSRFYKTSKTLCPIA